MLINAANLALLFEGFNTSFVNGLGEAQSNYAAVAMEIPSSTRANNYGWLMQVPGLREWLGDRQVQNISLSSYRIENKDWELTIAVGRNDIEDDQYGVFAPLFADMGRASATHPDQLVFPLLNQGFTTKCYDGANFFDTAHPVLDAAGAPQDVSNMAAGDGPAWFLLDTSRATKAMIYQNRRPVQLVAKTLENDDNVFSRKEYIFGVDARSNVGYGLWQLAYGSLAALNADTYAAARQAMHAITGDAGRPLGIMPDTLIVPTALEAAAMQILNADRNADGSSNIWAKTAKLIVTPWLN